MQLILKFEGVRRMKVIESHDTVKFPPGVTFTINKRVVTVKGPRGTLRRDFRHLHMEMERVGKDSIRVRKWFGIRKEVAAIRTICSHIENMIKGVTKGFRYKMRSVYAHFPINISLQEKNTVVEVPHWFHFEWSFHIYSFDCSCALYLPLRRWCKGLWRPTLAWTVMVWVPRGKANPYMARSMVKQCWRAYCAISSISFLSTSRMKEPSTDLQWMVAVSKSAILRQLSSPFTCFRNWSTVRTLSFILLLIINHSNTRNIPGCHLFAAYGTLYGNPWEVDAKASIIWKFLFNLSKWLCGLPKRWADFHKWLISNTPKDFLDAHLIPL